MSERSSVPPVKFFVITLHRDREILRQAVANLEGLFGPCDFTSDEYAFDATDYYEKEMGPHLRRRFFAFEKLMLPDYLVELKLNCNNVENDFRNAAGRQINLDPGYVDYYKVVLASNKHGGQKIYLNHGVYADMTMIMFKGKWESFAWGFPDFKSGKYDGVLSEVRETYRRQIRQSRLLDEP